MKAVILMSLVLFATVCCDSPKNESIHSAASNSPTAPPNDWNTSKEPAKFNPFLLTPGKNSVASKTQPAAKRHHAHHRNSADNNHRSHFRAGHRNHLMFRTNTAKEQSATLAKSTDNGQPSSAQNSAATGLQRRLLMRAMPAVDPLELKIVTDEMEEIYAILEDLEQAFARLRMLTSSLLPAGAETSSTVAESKNDDDSYEEDDEKSYD
ncbi:uncharacterized protein LOC131690421 [Topomyia yanbarensis]|uniref:uncharacterized protein LOC131690421 n=1 Tax=Topomyia yanbarensis TaxID=2498891 RepID=UPI00273B0A25|nr:uncharacterized protein LOC131690421 [Topomyia yanbarensis]